MRNLQFNMRTTLVIVTIIAACFAINDVALRGRYSDSKTVDRITEAHIEVSHTDVQRLGCPPHASDGGHVYFTYTGPGMTFPIVRSFNLPYLHRVTRIYLNGSSFTDETISILHELPHLERLDLRNTAVTESAITALKKQNLDLTINQLGNVSINSASNQDTIALPANAE